MIRLSPGNKFLSLTTVKSSRVNSSKEKFDPFFFDKKTEGMYPELKTQNFGGWN